MHIAIQNDIHIVFVKHCERSITHWMTKISFHTLNFRFWCDVCTSLIKELYGCMVSFTVQIIFIFLILLSRCCLVIERTTNDDTLEISDGIFGKMNHLIMIAMLFLQSILLWYEVELKIHTHIWGDVNTSNASTFPKLNVYIYHRPFKIVENPTAKKIHTSHNWVSILSKSENSFIKLRQ